MPNSTNPHYHPILLEACVDSVEAALAAETAGADRIELCQYLEVGGVTPGPGVIKMAKKLLKIPLMVLIRPRGGSFVYSDLEVEEMLEDIRFCRETGVEGVVIGALSPQGKMDRVAIRKLVEEAKGNIGGNPLEITFHKAFDRISDSVTALKTLEELMEMGFDRLLTSGLATTAFEGRELIAQMVAQTQGHPLQILGGGKVSPENAVELVEPTGLKEIHFSAVAGGRPLPEKVLKIRSLFATGSQGFL